MRNQVITSQQLPQFNGIFRDPVKRKGRKGSRKGREGTPPLRSSAPTFATFALKEMPLDNLNHELGKPFGTAYCLIT